MWECYRDSGAVVAGIGRHGNCKAVTEWALHQIYGVVVVKVLSVNLEVVAEILSSQEDSQTLADFGAVSFVSCMYEGVPSVVFSTADGRFGVVTTG